MRSWPPCRHGNRNCPRAGSRTTCADGAARGSGSRASGCQPWPSWRSITAWPGTPSSRHCAAWPRTAWSRSCRTGEHSGRDHRSAGRDTGGATDPPYRPSAASATLSARLQIGNWRPRYYRVRGAKRGANEGRRRATQGDPKRRSMQLDGTSGDSQRPSATVRLRLTSEGSQVRTLLRPQFSNVCPMLFLTRG